MSSPQRFAVIRSSAPRAGTGDAGHASDGVAGSTTRRGASARAIDPAGRARVEFVSRLAAARERHGYSLDALAAETKVSVALFTALERGDLSRWPRGIYRRSFFREYARTVGLPVDETFREFERLFPEDPGSRSTVTPAAVDEPLDGELRLQFGRLHRTGARSWHRRYAVPAIECLAVLVVATLAATATGWAWWSSAGVVALLYYAATTIALGATPAALWTRTGDGAASRILPFRRRHLRRRT